MLFGRMKTFFRFLNWQTDLNVIKLLEDLAGGTQDMMFLINYIFTIL